MTLDIIYYIEKFFGDVMIKYIKTYFWRTDNDGLTQHIYMLGLGTMTNNDKSTGRLNLNEYLLYQSFWKRYV